MKVTSKISHASVKVYINEVLHIHYVRERYVGLSSWQYENEGMYYIEIATDARVIATDYDRRDLWLLILAELEKAR